MTGTRIVPVVENYTDIDITSDAGCNEPLDAVKSLPRAKASDEELRG